MKFNWKKQGLFVMKALGMLIFITSLGGLLAMNGEQIIPVLDSFQSHRGIWFVVRGTIYSVCYFFIYQTWKALPAQAEENDNTRHSLKRITVALTVVLAVMELIIWTK